MFKLTLSDNPGVCLPAVERHCDSGVPVPAQTLRSHVRGGWPPADLRLTVKRHHRLAGACVLHIRLEPGNCEEADTRLRSPVTPRTGFAWSNPNLTGSKHNLTPALKKSILVSYKNVHTICSPKFKQDLGKCRGTERIYRKFVSYNDTTLPDCNPILHWHIIPALFYDL